MLFLKTVHVDTGKPYDIFIERGIIDNCGEYISKISKAEKITVITDSNVAPLYQWRVLNSLEKCGFQPKVHIFKAGEESKNLKSISDMYDTLAQFNMTRKDLVVALGGGVTGDMAGFAAATYLRGIDFVQIPTSLLAQVDSSVGGKTGVDLGLLSHADYEKIYSRRADEIKENDKMYAGYIERNAREMESVMRDMNMKIPANMDYTNMPGLTNELIEKLNKTRPENIATLSRIPGMTPAGIMVVLRKIKQGDKK